MEQANSVRVFRGKQENMAVLIQSGGPPTRVGAEYVDLKLSLMKGSKRKYPSLLIWVQNHALKSNPQSTIQRYIFE